MPVWLGLALLPGQAFAHGGGGGHGGGHGGGGHGGGGRGGGHSGGGHAAGHSGGGHAGYSGHTGGHQTALHYPQQTPGHTHGNGHWTWTHPGNSGWWRGDHRWYGWNRGYYLNSHFYWPRWWHDTWVWSVYAPYYIDTQVDTAPAEGPGYYWYYCQSAEGYYPDLQECPEGWQLIPAGE